MPGRFFWSPGLCRRAEPEGLVGYGLVAGVLALPVASHVGGAEVRGFEAEHGCVGPAFFVVEFPGAGVDGAAGSLPQPVVDGAAAQPAWGVACRALCPVAGPGPLVAGVVAGDAWEW